MIIRKMEPRDVPAIAELEIICFSDPWSENSIASELDNPLSYWLVAEDNGRIAGYVGSQSVLDAADMMKIWDCWFTEKLTDNSKSCPRSIISQFCQFSTGP